MRKLWAAVVIVAMFAIAAIALVGWDITRNRSAPTPAPSQPTAVPSSLATAFVPTTTSVVAPLLATHSSPDPGPATLASGTEIQNGKRGYAYWCISDAVGTCGIFDRYGGPAPFETLRVPPGSALAFVYHGPGPLTAISSLVYSLAGAGSGDYPTLRGGTPLPTTQTDRQAAITAPTPLGEYVVIVRISGEKNTTADFQFHIVVG